MAAEVLGIPYDKVRPLIADTSSLGYTFLTGGSRATFSNGVAVREAAQQVIKEMCARAAKIWEIPADAVTWEDGQAKPAGANAGDFEPLSFAEIAQMAGKTGGPIAGHAHLNAQGAGPSFGTHLVDVEVDQETGRVTILRYTVVQDAGKAVHPSYVEGQYQGGAVQGIGWALNEEYIYGAGRAAAEPGLPRLPHAGGLGRADDRHGDRRGRQPAPSVRRARRRRDPDRAADGGDRQRDRAGDRDPLHLAADVAAAGAQGARGGQRRRMRPG